MGHKSGHIECKNGWWHYRRRVPTDLKQYLPRREIRISLRTSSMKTAEHLGKCKDAKVEEVFTLLRSGFLDERQIVAAVGQLVSQAKPVTGLEEALKQYLEDKRPTLGGRTFIEYEIRAQAVRRFFKNRTLQAISRNEIVSLREKLAKELAPATVNKYLSWLKTFFGWCVVSGYLSANPAQGVSQIKDMAKRDRYTLEELKLLINQISPYKDSSTYPERYWVPLICMYMGLRVTEALQLVRSDVQEIEGVWCLSLTSTGGRSLKSKSSERIIPIHGELVRQGILPYIETRDGWLWPNVEGKGGRHGRISNGFSSWYGQQVNPKVTGNDNKTFHSLRHTFVDMLKQAGISEQLIAEIVGHARGSITMERYGKKYNPKVLKEAIEKLNYGEIFRSLK